MTDNRISGPIDGQGFGTSGSMTTSNSSLRVLLVDDLKPLLATLGTALQRSGLTVFTALSGMEAVESFKINRVDVVVCDLGMEGMDGFAVAAAIREICRQETKPRPPFILITGWGQDVTDLEDLPSAGVDMVLDKPIELPDLLRILNEIRERRESRTP